MTKVLTNQTENEVIRLVRSAIDLQSRVWKIYNQIERVLGHDVKDIADDVELICSCFYGSYEVSPQIITDLIERWQEQGEPYV